MFQREHRGMQRAALLILVLTALGLPAAPAAGASTVSIPPTADVGFPFLCDWGYDWETRCFRDDGDRLPIGGVDDKAWRAGLRFSLTAIPAGATVTAAELRVYHDGVCVAPLRFSRPCVAPGSVVDAHRVLTGPWFAEREPEFDPRVLATAVVFSAPDPQWLTWDLTSLARGWHEGLWPNSGVLLKLQDGDEDYGVSGPYGPSSSYPDPELRPRLVVTYAGPGPH
jgi:hypothetical protein